MDLNWYPVYTNPRAEKKAFKELTQKGITAYMPVRKVLRIWSDRKKWVEMPLLPSYLFIQISASQLSEVLMCRGISRFIYFSNEIATIPARQINQLKLLLASESELEVVDQHFETGQAVIVKAGPLQGLRGELVSWHSKQRLLVRIEYITESLLIQIPPSFLEHWI